MIDQQSKQYMQKKKKEKEAFSNLDDIQDQLNQSIQQTQQSQSSTQDATATLQAASTQPYQQTNDDYVSAQTALSTTITNYNNTVNSQNPYLGQNVLFSSSDDSLGYMTQQGVFKLYGTEGDDSVLTSTAGMNGCPSSQQQQTIGTGTIPYDTPGATSSGTGNYTFVVGTPMVSGQSCGNEGINVFVSGINKNPTSSFLGSYYDNMQSPTMSFIDNGNESYTFSSCRKAASDNGYQYFALQGANTATTQNQRVKCAVSNDVDAAMQGQEVTGSCQQGSDMNLYGSPNSIALYQTPTAQYIGTYGDSWNRAMQLVNGGSQSFSYQQCYQYALQNNYQFFALQNASTANNGQCAVSNSFSQTTEYGKSNSYRKDSTTNLTYGGGWGNSVYGINSQTAQNLGCYAKNRKTNQSSMKSLLTNTDYQTCLETAQAQNYQYFGLGNGGPGSATCYATNSKQQATQYGIYSGDVVLQDGYTYGSNGVNSIYNLTSEGYPQNLGMVGYVDQDAVMHPYSSQDITYDGTQYGTKQNFNATNGEVIQTMSNSSVQDCQTACSADSTCGGFTYNTQQSSCALQTSSILDMPGSTPPDSIVQGINTVIKIPSVVNNDSCNKSVVSTDSVQWENYVMGDNMTSDQLCGVQAASAAETEEVAAQEEIMNSMYSTTTSAVQSANSVYEGFSMNSLNGQLSHGNSLVNAAAYLMKDPSTTKEIPQQVVSVSHISVVQKNTWFLFWCILAVIVFMMTIYTVTKFAEIR